MAGTYAVYYRNHDGSDSTRNDSYTSSSPCPTIDTFGWSAPSGKSFKEWNTSRDGSGTSMFPGETYTQIEGNRYAIWEDAPVPYLTDDKEIKSIADAIRTKGGTSSALVYPDGFVSAINAISTGGGAENAIINRTISGTYSNSTITEIGDYAFYNCKNLEGISADNCTKVGSCAFQSCVNLLDANISSCQSIGSYAFSGCSKLVNIEMQSAVTIGSCAFYHCYSIVNASFPYCTTLGQSAFIECRNLAYASFPNCTTGNTTIFYYCGSLTTVYMPKITFLNNYFFSYCSKLSDVNVNGVISVGAGAFSSCWLLSSITFPKCNQIRSSAFINCYKLLSVYLTSTAVAQLLNSNAFSNTPIAGRTTSTGGVYGSIYVPASLYSAYKTSTNWTYFADRFVSV